MVKRQKQEFKSSNSKSNRGQQGCAPRTDLNKACSMVNHEARKFYGARSAPFFLTSMPNYRRANVAGGACFFTVNTLHRLPALTEPAIRLALREAIRQTRLLHPFDIDAWVLLPDHLHCIGRCRPAIRISRSDG